MKVINTARYIFGLMAILRTAQRSNFTKYIYEVKCSYQENTALHVTERKKQTKK